MATRNFTGEHFVEHHAEAVNIGAVIDFAGAAHLLRRDVIRGPHGDAGQGDAELLRFGTLLGIDQLGEAEIADFDDAFFVDDIRPGPQTATEPLEWA